MAVCDFVLVEDRQTLRDWFGLLDEGVEAIESRLPQRECVAADLFTAAVNCEVELRLVRVEEEVCGFMATQTSTSILGHRRLMVWMLYLRPGIPDVMADVVSELDYMAGEKGCSGVDFSTVRPAWQRRLARHGYSPTMMTFSKEVTYG